MNEAMNEVTDLLKNENDLVEVAMGIGDIAGWNVIPVWGASDTSREKVCKYPYTSKKYISPDTAEDEIIKAFDGASAIAIALTADSDLIIVDADTPNEMTAFQLWLFAETGQELNLIPTVKTPGVKKDGKDLHYDGGHFYFKLPSGVLSSIANNESRGLNGAPRVEMFGNTFMLKAGKGYVLTPPSRRSEGLYTVPEGGKIYYTEELGLTDAFIDILQKPLPKRNEGYTMSSAPSFSSGSGTGSSRAEKIRAYTLEHQEEWAQLFNCTELGGASCAGGSCSTFVYNRAAGDISGVVHRGGCDYSDDLWTFGIFSETMKDDLGLEMSNYLFSFWGILKSHFCNGDTDEALIQFGIYDTPYKAISQPL